MAAQRVRARSARKNGGKVKKSHKSTVRKKSKAAKKYRIESTSSKRKLRGPRNGSRKRNPQQAKDDRDMRRKKPRRSRQLIGSPPKKVALRDDRDRLDKMDDDELSRELGLGADANEAVANANRGEGSEIFDDEEPSLDELFGVPDGEVRGARSHPGDHDGSN